MRRFWLSVSLLIVVLSLPLSAQNHPYPGAVQDPPVICTGCAGNNSVGEPNADKPTFPYDTPMAVHVGRFVDSSSTRSVRNGMRTIRSGVVRIAPVGRNRIYLQLGATLGAYRLDSFFSGKLVQPMVAVNTMPVQNILSPYGGRNPFEKLSKPDQYFYAEASVSGWSTVLVDSQDVLADFDADDRGYVYVGTYNFGWGILSDPGLNDGSRLPSVVQVSEASASSLFWFRSGSAYYVQTSLFSPNGSRLYDVTDVSNPVLVIGRSGSARTTVSWSKFDAGERVAFANADGHVRIYTYAALIDGSAPLIDLAPQSGRQFLDVSFDDDGILWLAERPTSGNAGSIALWKLTPSGGGYTPTQYDVYGSDFAAEKIHAADGYIAVGGRVDGTGGDLRLFRVSGGVPALLDTNGFFRKYYTAAPSGYAQPGFYSLTPSGVRILKQGAKTYLFFNNYGLGDIYELGDGPRITSMTPLSGVPAGGTNVTLYGTGFTAASTVTFGGVAAVSTFVSETQMTAVSPLHAEGPVNVVVSAPGEAPMTATEQFTYVLGIPQIVATATSTTSVTVSWAGVPDAAFYEVSRRAPAGTWSVIGTPSASPFIDGDRTPETTYVYRVRAVDAGGFSANSAIDLATTMGNVSSTIVAGAPIVVSDFAALRARVNAVRAAAGLGEYPYTSALTGPILAFHMFEIRGALAQARTSLGLASNFSESISDAPIKASNLNEVLNLMR